MDVSMSDIADLVVLTGSPISEPIRVGGNQEWTRESIESTESWATKSCLPK
jgi:hypothetical protein